MPKPTEREPDQDDKFRIPKDIERRAVDLSRKGVRIRVSPLELISMMKLSDRALNTQSFDADHDALVEIRDRLSDIYEDPDRRTQ